VNVSTHDNPNTKVESTRQAPIGSEGASEGSLSGNGPNSVASTSDEQLTVQRSTKKGSIRDIDRELQAMNAAIANTVTDPRRRTYWGSRWQSRTLLATKRMESNRKQFYGLRLFGTISAVVVPALVGLNLGGTGGVVVRWATFALSLVAALSVALLSLFRFGDRWFLYRTFQDDLLRAGWRYIDDDQVQQPKKDTETDVAWRTFVASTEAAIAKYNSTYDAEVILPAEATQATAPTQSPAQKPPSNDKTPMTTKTSN
jgi:hypothetical protein